MSENTTPQKSPRKGRFIGVLAVTGVVLAGAFTVQAVADSKAYQHVKAEYVHKAGWRGHGHKRFADLSESEIQQRIDRVVKHVAIEIDANDEQREKIVALLTAVAMDMKPIRERMIASREQLQAILVAEQIDRAALEALRVERLAEFDEISKNLVTAIADVAEVLTPEQRKVLDERIKEFRTMFGHHRRG